MLIEIKKSTIHGLGVFAKEIIHVGEWHYIYGMAVPGDNNYCFDDDDTHWEPFPPFRYLNHADEPNCEVGKDDNGEWYIEVIKTILIGEELTISYEDDYDPDSEGESVSS